MRSPTPQLSRNVCSADYSIRKRRKEKKKKRARTLDAAVKGLCKLFHLHQADAHDGCLGVATEFEAVDKAGAQGDDVLEGAAELGPGHVLHDIDAEVVAVEEFPEELAVDGVARADGRLAELFHRDLVGHVGAHEHRHVNVEAVADDVRDELQALCCVDALTHHTDSNKKD